VLVLKINTDGYDKIHVDAESLINFQKWFSVDEAKDYFMPTFEKGVLVMHQDGEKSYLFFECKDAMNIRFKYIAVRDEVYSVEWERVDGEFNLLSDVSVEIRLKFMLNFKLFTVNEMFFYLTIHFMNIEPKKVETKSETKRIVKNRKKKSKASKKKVVYVTNKVYKVHIKSEFTESEKREYIRKTEGWMVRGHFRNYKTGKRSWVPAYPKGELRDILEREYKIITNDK
jgi:hypothetical protein